MNTNDFETADETGTADAKAAADFAQFLGALRGDTPATASTPEPEPDTARGPRPDLSQGGHGFAPPPNPTDWIARLVEPTTYRDGRGNWRDVRDR